MKSTVRVRKTRKKKPYAPPRLTSYGKFKDIVQGVDGSKQEPGGTTRSRF